MKNEFLQIIEYTMQKRLEYLKNPATVVTILVFVFGLGASRTNLNGRVKYIEQQVGEINYIEIQKDISEIKANVAWIMNDLQSKK